MAMGDLTRINTNIQAQKSLQMLQKTNGNLSLRQLRLATGTRINSAEDDSAGYSIAKKLEAKVRGQNQALANIGDAKGMLTVGEGALNTVMDILHTMKEKAVQAANDTMGDDERAAIESQLTELREEVDATLSKSEFNGYNLFDGDGGATRSLTFQVGDVSGDTFGVDIDKMDSTTLALASAAYSYDIDTDSTWGNGGNRPIITAATGTFDGAAGEYSFKVKSIDATAGAEAVTFEVKNSAGQTEELVYDATTAAADTLDTTAVGSMLEGLTLSFLTSSGTGINDAATATGYFQANDTFTLEVKKGGLQVGDADEAANAISNIDSAIGTVSDALASLGDSQKRMSFKMENLQTSLTNYDAARSRIMDADFAKEQMEIVKLQILQQTGTATLAQANSAPQSVLQLIGG